MSERERLLEKIALSLRHYGSERDWTKMRPDEMAEVALRVIEEAGPIEIVRCGCKATCGDDGDIDGPGTCKGLPQPPSAPLVELEVVDRDPMQGNRGYMS